MDVLRTPDERFEGLADWPYAPRYTEITDPDGTRLRIHHVDEGPREQRPILLMHGEPSWAYLYRKIIADLADRGRRTVAPDLVGFGRSDKPAARTDYTYERHVAWMSDWLVRNDLKDIVLFCQDWGGLIGLRLVGASRTLRGGSRLQHRHAGGLWQDRGLRGLAKLQPERARNADRLHPERRHGA